jgi:hypothetical protein
MREFLSAAFTALALGLAAPAAGEEGAPPPGEEDPEQLLQESVETFMRALDALIRSIPQYEMPEITEDGDIIIRRKKPPPFGPEPAPPPHEEPGVEDEETDI